MKRATKIELLVLAFAVAVALAAAARLARAVEVHCPQRADVLERHWLEVEGTRLTPIDMDAERVRYEVPEAHASSARCFADVADPVADAQVEELQRGLRDRGVVRETEAIYLGPR